MLAMAYERTLAEDWLVRRQRLLASQTIPEQQRVMQLQVLDYLIGRYGDSPEAAQPARFASTAEFYSNDRAIVVHHHLGGAIAGVKSQNEANRRVGAILERLHGVHDGDPSGELHRGVGAPWDEELDRSPAPAPAEKNWTWSDFCAALTERGREDTQIAATLRKDPRLPRRTLAYLCRHLSDMDEAFVRLNLRFAALLWQCRTESTPYYAARARGKIALTPIATMP